MIDYQKIVDLKTRTSTKNDEMFKHAMSKLLVAKEHEKAIDITVKGVDVPNEYIQNIAAFLYHQAHVGSANLASVLGLTEGPVSLAKRVTKIPVMPKPGTNALLNGYSGFSRTGNKQMQELEVVAQTARCMGLLTFDTVEDSIDALGIEQVLLEANLGDLGLSMDKLIMFSEASLATQAWADATTYQIDDYVAHTGNVYRCIQNHVSDVGFIEPGVSPLYWRLETPQVNACLKSLANQATGGNPSLATLNTAELVMSPAHRKDALVIISETAHTAITQQSRDDQLVCSEKWDFIVVDDQCFPAATAGNTWGFMVDPAAIGGVVAGMKMREKLEAELDSVYLLSSQRFSLGNIATLFGDDGLIDLQYV